MLLGRPLVLSGNPLDQGSVMADDSFCEFVLDQLRGLGHVRCQPMFGGFGLYRDDSFFAIIHRGTLYFRTDEQSRPRYTAGGMQPFSPNPRQTMKDYYEVPPDVVEDSLQLVEWGIEAVRCGEAK